MATRIRQASKSDLVPLTALARRTYADAFGHSMKPTDLAFHLKQNLAEACVARYLETDEILVAEDEGGLVGFVQVGKATRESYGELVNPGDLALRRLYVRSDKQNQGIGQRLLDASLGEGVTTFLDVWEDNLRARRFYERNRFQVVGKLEFRVESNEPTGFDLVMRRS